MKTQTKLVNCGSKVFVYDFKSSEKIENLGFDQDGIKGILPTLKG